MTSSRSRTWADGASSDLRRGHGQPVARHVGRARSQHLGQTVKTMAKQYREAVGPWRELLPILDAP